MPASQTTARVPLERAVRIATIVRDVLAAACPRIEIAGSIRRRVAMVKDIELVAMPRLRLGIGDEVLDDDLEVLVRELVRDGWATWRRRRDGQLMARGPRYYALTHRDSAMPVDLFAVRPPAQWGAILAIRTGPASYSESLVTRCKLRGLRCEDGRLVRQRDGVELPTPEERQFIEACGFPWAAPEWRVE